MLDLRVQGISRGLASWRLGRLPFFLEPVLERVFL